MLECDYTYMSSYTCVIHTTIWVLILEYTYTYMRSYTCVTHKLIWVLILEYTYTYMSSYYLIERKKMIMISFNDLVDKRIWKIKQHQI